jgi:hypothetical protein
MPRLVFLLEEPSMARCLDGLLPRLIPGIEYKLVVHEGKQALERSIPIKLRGWNIPDDHFVIVRDQDSGDCRAVKQHLLDLCQGTGKAPALVRIACRELESWFLGDLTAVSRALNKSSLSKMQGKKKYRNPDRLGSPSKELDALIGGYGKISGARSIGPVLSLDQNTSASFRAFVSGVRRVAQSLQG